MNTRKTKKVGAKNTGPHSVVAQARRVLYTKGIARVIDAMEHGYPLEAIALLESMIADRLEARRDCISAQETNKRVFDTAYETAEFLAGKKQPESDAAKEIYEAVKAWAPRRNELLHQMVKLAEDEAKAWDARLQEAQSTAKDGLELFRKLDALVKKLNKPKPDSASKKTKN